MRSLQDWLQDRDYSPLSTPNGLSVKSELPTSVPDPTVTPNKRSFMDTPRTPTPFKKALADLEKKSGPIPQLPDTPTRLEDITEIMKKDQDISANYETDTSLMITVGGRRWRFFFIDFGWFVAE